MFPPVWLVPIALAGTALRYDPRLQAYVGLLYVAGLAALVAVGGNVATEERAALLAQLALGFGLPPNVVRLTMIGGAAVILVLVARRGRALLEAAVEESRSRLSLTRFVPGELVPLLTQGEAAGGVAGRRQSVVVAFVDMRGSTRLAERTDPLRFAVFMSSFRRRIMAATAACGGVVDKFVGDGALVVFGVPEPRPDDARRGLAFAHDLQARVARWNARRRFEPAVSVGVGVHCGEVFCGLVGDPRRLEFTVLGDVVNVAARLEKATKELGCPILASDAVVEAAGRPPGWTRRGTVPIAGRDEGMAAWSPGGSDGGASGGIVDGGTRGDTAS